MALPIFQRTVTDATGDILANASVEVRKESDGALATIYSDRAGTTSISNPTTADANGFVQFYAAHDEYKVTATSGLNSITWRYVPLVGESAFYNTDDRPISVDSISEMLELENLADGQQVILSNYHSDTECGGDNFKILTSGDLTLHDGGKYIDLSRTFPTDWTNQTQLAAWYAAGTGTGTLAVRLYNGAVKGEMYGVKADGITDDTLAINAACLSNSESIIDMPDGELVNTAVPSNIDDVHLRGSGRTTFSGTNLPVFSGVYTGNKEVALVAGVIRYYPAGASGAGWYFLSDQGDNHDPILLSPITSSGTSSVVLDVNIDAFGLDETLWTPSGVVVGCDDALASEGVTFGASVGTSSMTITGKYATTHGSLINYNGSSWSADGFYTNFDFTNNRLRVTRDSTLEKQSFSDGKAPIITPYITNTGTFTMPAIGRNTSTDFDVTFWDSSGNILTTPSTDMAFYVHDPVRRNASFNFNTQPISGSNIWIVGMFSRKPASY